MTSFQIRRLQLPLVALWLVLGAAACKKGDAAKADAAQEDNGNVEDVTIVVEADKSRILQEETALKTRRQEFETERARLEREREEIAEKLNSISKKDKSQRDKLESAEKELNDQQKRLRDRSESFDSERAKLEQEKSKLLERIGKMTATKGGLTVEQREEAIARREAAVAQREKDVAKREAEAARGLGDIRSMMEEVRTGVSAAKAAAAQAPAAAPARSSSNAGGEPATKVSVVKQQKSIKSKMEAKGILSEDLPATVRDLDANAGSAVSSKDYASAAEAFSQLGQAVDSIAINHAFVQAKMARINRQFEDKKVGNSIDDSKQKKIQTLLAEASDSFSDGRYDRANKKINQIYGIMQAR